MNDPRILAREAADRYVAAIRSDLPFDVAPGGVNLVEACTRIQDAVQAEDVARRAQLPEADRVRFDAADDREDTAMRAGYLLGVEIGLRLGGAR